MSTEVLSIRIRRELKDEAQKLNINLKEVIEKALADAIEQEKKKKLEDAINELLPKMEKISEDQWVKAVKECRRER